MADVKITDLANLAAPDGADLLESVDVSDTSSAATGTNKKLTLTNFQVWLGGFSYTPEAHAASHATGQTDAIAPADIGAEPAFTKNTGFNKNFGSAAGTVCQGNDSRLSDARTPTAHATTHNHGGSDALALFGAAVQGVVGASGGGTINFLRADGAWAAPPAGGGWVDGTTISDWGDTGQTVTAGGTTQVVDLDGGHFLSGTLTASKTINFTNTANHANTSWDAIIDLATFTPAWQFGGVAVTLPDDYEISDGGVHWFTFRKVGSAVYVSERGMQ